MTSRGVWSSLAGRMKIVDCYLFERSQEVVLLLNLCVLESLWERRVEHVVDRGSQEEWVEDVICSAPATIVKDQ